MGFGALMFKYKRHLLLSVYYLPEVFDQIGGKKSSQSHKLVSTAES